MSEQDEINDAFQKLLEGVSRLGPNAPKEYGAKVYSAYKAMKENGLADKRTTALYTMHRASFDPAANVNLQQGLGIFGDKSVLPDAPPRPPSPAQVRRAAAKHAADTAGPVRQVTDFLDRSTSGIRAFVANNPDLGVMDEPAHLKADARKSITPEMRAIGSAKAKGIKSNWGKPLSIGGGIGQNLNDVGMPILGGLLAGGATAATLGAASPLIALLGTTAAGMGGGWGAGKAQEAIDTSSYGAPTMATLGQSKGEFRADHPIINLLSETVPQLAFNKLQIGGAGKALGTGVRALTRPRALKAELAAAGPAGDAARAAVASALNHGIGAGTSVGTAVYQGERDPMMLALNFLAGGLLGDPTKLGHGINSVAGAGPNFVRDISTGPMRGMPLDLGDGAWPIGAAGFTGARSARPFPLPDRIARPAAPDNAMGQRRVSAFAAKKARLNTPLPLDYGLPAGFVPPGKRVTGTPRATSRAAVQLPLVDDLPSHSMYPSPVPTADPFEGYLRSVGLLPDSSPQVEAAPRSGRGLLPTPAIDPSLPGMRPMPEGVLPASDVVANALESAAPVARTRTTRKAPVKKKIAAETASRPVTTPDPLPARVTEGSGPQFASSRAEANARRAAREEAERLTVRPAPVAEVPAPAPTRPVETPPAAQRPVAPPAQPEPQVEPTPEVRVDTAHPLGFSYDDAINGPRLVEPDLTAKPEEVTAAEKKTESSLRPYIAPIDPELPPMGKKTVKKNVPDDWRDKFLVLARHGVGRLSFNNATGEYSWTHVYRSSGEPDMTVTVSGDANTDKKASIEISADYTTAARTTQASTEPSPRPVRAEPAPIAGKPVAEPITRAGIGEAPAKTGAPDLSLDAHNERAGRFRAAEDERIAADYAQEQAQSAWTAHRTAANERAFEASMQRRADAHAAEAAIYKEINDANAASFDKQGFPTQAYKDARPDLLPKRVEPITRAGNAPKDVAGDAADGPIRLADYSKVNRDGTPKKEMSAQEQASFDAETTAARDRLARSRKADSLEGRLDGLRISADDDGGKAAVKRFAAQLHKDGIIDDAMMSEVNRVSADRDMGGSDVLDMFASEAQDHIDGLRNPAPDPVADPGGAIKKLQDAAKARKRVNC